ncbi:hypothetical protein ACOACO_00595 [Nocardioides sp. CPCC 205120]|uniref:hypothetical protein n=1 Tax=Nocardioides sp. CPCC 205120 TaxID=3406462 RepID=UPI003B50C0A4
MKKLLVAVFSAVLMTAGLVAGTGVSPASAAEEPYPGTYTVGSRIVVGAPYQYGRQNAAKPLTVFFVGSNGQRVEGEVVTTVRRVGTADVRATSYDYFGTTRRIWTPNFGIRPTPANYQVVVSFFPYDEAYQPTTRSFYVWVTRTGRP